MYKANEDVAAQEIHDNNAELMPGSESISVYSVVDGEVCISMNHGCLQSF